CAYLVAPARVTSDYITISHHLPVPATTHSNGTTAASPTTRRSWRVPHFDKGNLGNVTGQKCARAQVEAVAGKTDGNVEQETGGYLAVLCGRRVEDYFSQWSQQPTCCHHAIDGDKDGGRHRPCNQPLLCLALGIAIGFDQRKAGFLAVACSDNLVQRRR